MKEIIDMMENPGSSWLCGVVLLLVHLTCADVRKFTKFKYDGSDRCLVNLTSMIQVVNLNFIPRQKHYILDSTNSIKLLEYHKLWGTDWNKCIKLSIAIIKFICFNCNYKIMIWLLNMCIPLARLVKITKTKVEYKIGYCLCMRQSFSF